MSTEGLLQAYASATTLGKNALEIGKACVDTLGRNGNAIAAMKICPRVYFVGSGSSFSVALFAHQLLQRHSGVSSWALTMNDYIKNGKDDATVVLFSQSGATPDAFSVIRRAQELNSSVYVVTGADPSATDRTVHHMLPPENIFRIHHGFERAFVNTKGVGASCIVAIEIIERICGERFAMALDKGTIERLERSARAFAEHLPFDGRYDCYICLGSDMAAPARTELELKICEGLLETSEQSELKQFTHGRFFPKITAAGRYAYIYFEGDSDAPLVSFLRARLPGDSIIIRQSEREPAVAALEFMFFGIYVFLGLAAKKSLSLGQPFDPAEFRLPANVRDINVGFDLHENAEKLFKTNLL